MSDLKLKKCEGDDNPRNTNFTRAGWVANRRLLRRQRVTWDFAYVFVCFGSGILFVSLEKVFILALEGTRFPSLLTPNVTL